MSNQSSAGVPAQKDRDMTQETHNNDDPFCARCRQPFHWNEDADRDDQAPLCNSCAQKGDEVRDLARRIGEGEDPEVGALAEEALRDAQCEAREADAAVAGARRQLELAEQRAQRARVCALKLAGRSADAYLAPPGLRPEDLARERGRIPRASIRCAHWDEAEGTVRLGLQLGDSGPGLWIEVSRQELGYHAQAHGARTDDMEPGGEAREYFDRVQAWRAWAERGIAGSAMMTDEELREAANARDLAGIKRLINEVPNAAT